MSGISSRVVTALRNLNKYGTKWMRTQAPHWTTADSLALVLAGHQTMPDDNKDCAEEGWVYDNTQFICAEEGYAFYTNGSVYKCNQGTGWYWVETQDPDIWGEYALYGEREEWPPYDSKEKEERPITLMVIEDLLARDKMGHKKHGRPLTKSTYSDFHKELYEELMDALVYLRALRENDAK